MNHRLSGVGWRVQVFMIRLLALFYVVYLTNQTRSCSAFPWPTRFNAALSLLFVPATTSQERHIALPINSLPYLVILLVNPRHKLVFLVLGE